MVDEELVDYSCEQLEEGIFWHGIRGCLSNEVEASPHSWVEGFPAVLPSPVPSEEGFSPSSYQLPKVSTILPNQVSGVLGFGR